MRQNSPNFTDTVIDSDLFTTNLERHLRIITNRSIKTLAEHLIRIQKRKKRKTKTERERKRKK